MSDKFKQEFKEVLLKRNYIYIVYLHFGVGEIAE